jgi:hypothetical protein
MENLSHLVPGLVGGDSMGATNTVSPVPPFGAPGSESESVKASDVMGEPGPVIPPERPRTVLHPSGAPREGNPWNRADGSPWVSSSDESSPGGESPGAATPGPWGQK